MDVFGNDLKIYAQRMLKIFLFRQENAVFRRIIPIFASNYNKRKFNS